MALRFNLTKQIRILSTNKLIQNINFNNYCDGKREKPGEKGEKDVSSKKQQASKRLNELLQSIIKNEPSTKSTKFARPPKPKKTDKSEKKEIKDDKKQIVEAAKNVAEALGGDVKETQSQLISKLLEQTVVKDKTDIHHVIQKMKVESDEKTSRSQQVKKILKDKTPLSVSRTLKVKEAERLNLFSGTPLNIFQPAKETPLEETVLKTWQTLHERELRLAVTHPPSNYFQQMILWTEQGKIWKFPIDNEQAMDDEQNVYFAEHVILEPLLDDWCPKQGPIRHFMELVCVGLSKNHYLTVEEKRSHINWFKDYFMEKEELLKELGAVPANTKNVASEKSVET